MRKHSPVQGHRPATRRHKTRLLVEKLEDRTVPAGLSFTPTEVVAAIRVEDPVGALASFLADEPEHALAGLIELSASRELLAQADGSHVTQVALAKDADPLEAVRQLEALPFVVWAAPNYVYREDIHGDPRDFIPNDPQYSSQYHHPLMQNHLAWDTTLGSASIIIAITDDGVSLAHADLAANIWVNDDPVNGIDDDANGFIDDTNGWDFSAGDRDPNPPAGQSHGTHVAGIAAARTDNAVGVAGTAGHATIMPIRFYGTGAWTSTVILNSYSYAVNNGAKIISTSYNVDGFVSDPTFLAALNYLYTNGGMHFNSAGNNNQLNPPRQVFDHSLYVVSTDSADRKSSFSNYGFGVDISAPGSSILSTLPGNTYGFNSGTSMAAPNAAGAAALIWSANPTWTREQVAAKLIGKADNIDALNPGFAGLLGSGRANSFRAITEALQAPRIKSVQNLPAEGGTTSSPITAFSVDLANVLNPTTLTLSNFELRGDGPDNLFGTADDVLLSLSLPSGFTYRIGTNRLSFTVGTSMTADRYRFSAISGGLRDPFGTALDGNGDTVPGDNFTRTFTFAPPAPPDLSWSGGGIVGPTATSTTDTFTISRNYAVTDAAVGPNFTIGYFRSIDAVFGNPDDVLLGTQTISAAADKTVGMHPGSSPALQITTPGTYFLFARVDNGNTVAESNESNNVAQAPAQVTVTAVPIVDNGQPGYSEIGTWASWTGGFNNNFRYSEPVEGNMARWTVSGLSPGTYNVQATWVGDPSHSTNVVYRVYDGAATTPLATVVVNQSVEPVGDVVSGRPFQLLAAVTLTGTSVRVEMDSNSSGYTVADAVRAVAAGAPTTDLNWSGGGITGPTSATTTTTFTINRTYNVSGTAVGPNFTIGYYRSNDAVFGNPDDVLLGSETITAPADKTVGTHAGTSPALQINLAGTYFLFAKVDNGNTVLETNESNNVAQAPAQVVVTGTTAVIVDNNQSGYSEVGTWFDWSGVGFNSNFRYADPGTGNTATWSLSGLTPGSVNVQATWVSDASHASNVVYRVYDGGSTTPLLTVTIDQRNEPVGTVVGGRPFQSLGTVTLTGSTLRVEMDSSASGYAIADAIRAVFPA